LEQIGNEYILIRVAEKLEEKGPNVVECHVIILYRNFHSRRGMLDFAKSILNYQTKRSRSNVDVIDRFHTKR